MAAGALDRWVKIWMKLPVAKGSLFAKKGGDHNNGQCPQATVKSVSFGKD